MSKGKKKKRDDILSRLSEEDILAIKKQLVLESSNRRELPKEVLFFAISLGIVAIVIFLVAGRLTRSTERKPEPASRITLPEGSLTPVASSSQIDLSTLSKSQPLSSSSTNTSSSQSSSEGSAVGVRIPLSSITETASFYTVSAGNKEIRFFVLKDTEGVYRSALDACDICYWAKLGYHQEGNEMVCNKCGQRFPSIYINVIQGGCNPVPIERFIDGKELVINSQNLSQGIVYF